MATHAPQFSPEPPIRFRTGAALVVRLGSEQLKDEITAVIELVKKLSASSILDKWFRLSNNFIGFSSEIRNSYSFLNDLDITAFEESIEQFEISFKEFDVSKIKLGKARRIAVAYFIKNLESLAGHSSSVITDKLLNVLE